MESPREILVGTSIATSKDVAHLNLRDHRIEAKIAYVGPEAHILSTFDRLRNEPAFTRTRDRMLDWRPTTKRFRDCDIHVTLVVGEGEGADGVVVVEERAPASTVEEELARLERALGQVLASLEAAPASNASASADGAHPLLTALRKVLDDTVRQHVAELAKELENRDQDDALAVHVLKALEELDAREQIKQVREDIRTAADSVDKVMLRIQRFDAFMKRIEKVEDSIEAMNTRITELIEELKKPKKSWFT